MFGYHRRWREGIAGGDLLNRLVTPSVVLLVLTCILHPTGVLASTRRKATQQAQGTLYPQIQAVYVAYRTPGVNNYAYPYSDVHVVLRAIIIATVGTQTRAYTDLTGSTGWTSAGTWHVYGKQGWAVPATRNWPDYYWLSNVSNGAYQTVYQWQWGTPTFTWKARYQYCTDYDSSLGRTYAYSEYVPTDISGWGTNTTGILLPVGTARYMVTAAYTAGGSTQTKSSPSSETATRIPVKSAQSFNITIPPPDDPGYASAVKRLDYLRWLYMFTNVPYEYGGHWFGGVATDTHDGNDAYDGHGIDCSGLVSAAANLAGYNWTGGYLTGNWRYSTQALGGVSEEVGNNWVAPGHIMLLNWQNPNTGEWYRHVRTVYYRSGDTIRMIAAEAGDTSEVVDGVEKSLAYETSTVTGHYVPRSLTLP